MSALLEFLQSRTSDPNMPQLSRSSSTGGPANSTAISRSSSTISSSFNGGQAAASCVHDPSGSNSGRLSKAGSINKLFGSSALNDSPDEGFIPGFAGLGVSNNHNSSGRHNYQQHRRTADNWRNSGTCGGGGAEEPPASSANAAAAAPSVQGHIHGHELVLKGRGLTCLPQDIVEVSMLHQEVSFLSSCSQKVLPYNMLWRLMDKQLLALSLPWVFTRPSRESENGCM